MAYIERGGLSMKAVRPSNTPYEGTRAADCEPEAAVYLDLGRGEIEVPTVSTGDDDRPSVETHIRTTGNSDITRLSDVVVPLEWGGDEIRPAVEILRRQPDRAPRVRIELRDPSGDYRTVHDGYVRTISPHKGNVAIVLSVGDWADLFGSIGFGKEYGSNADVTAAQVITDAVNVVAEEHGAIDELRLKGGMEELPPNAKPSKPESGGVASYPVPGAKAAEVAQEIAGELGLLSLKSFSRTKDTAADAMNWACNKIGADWQIHYDPQEEATTIYVDTSESAPLYQDVRIEDYDLGNLESGRAFDNPLAESFEGRPIIVESNNAAFQLSPLHTIKGRGNSVQSSDAGVSKIRDGKARPVATVAHETLRSMVGDVGQPPIEAVDSQSIDEVETTTRERLKKEIREAAGGEIITVPEPGVRPFAIVEALPICGGTEIGDFAPLRYEVEEVIHRIDPVDPDRGANQKPSRTLLRCGIAVRDSDFEVLDSGMQKI